MSRLSSILDDLGTGRVAFWCPGCNEAHVAGQTVPLPSFPEDW